MKNFKQYLEEASQRGARNQGLRSTVDQEGNHTPGLIRKVIGALGGQRISSANAEESKQSRKMKMDPNPRPIDSSQYGGRPTSPPITGRPPIDPKLLKPSFGVKGKGRTLPKPDKLNHPKQHPNHPMYEDSGERGGSPEDGNTGYGLPRKNSRFYPAKNKRPTGPGTEYHMETLRQKYEARKAAEAAAAAAEAAKSAGEQEPEHWRDFPTDVRYDQY